MHGFAKGIMSKRRSFSMEQKLQILREAETEGMLTTCREYEIAQSLFYRWKHAFDQKRIDGLQAQYYRLDPEVKTLREENEKLKKIFGKQALELEVKNELLNLSADRQEKRNSSKGRENDDHPL
jgi:putative transposase